MEKLDLCKIKEGWKNEPKLNNPLQENSALAAKACFYSLNISEWLPKTSVPFED